ncbi:unnamed protein product [Symbiodinium sp. CCMP2456]|nr:unnamed protein product [Symbiodinium sp. CCMP2456]
MTALSLANGFVHGVMTVLSAILTVSFGILISPALHIPLIVLQGVIIQSTDSGISPLTIRLLGVNWVTLFRLPFFMASSLYLPLRLALMLSRFLFALIVVTPQPAQQYAVLVAVPPWADILCGAGFDASFEADVWIPGQIESVAEGAFLFNLLHRQQGIFRHSTELLVLSSTVVILVMNTSPVSSVHLVFLMTIFIGYAIMSRLSPCSFPPEFQTDSWLTIGEGLAVVESGTRPGDALADVVFAFLFSSVLQKVRQAIFAAGYEVVLLWAASWFRQLSTLGCPDGTLAPIDVAWMDDLVILLSLSTPEGALAATKGAATALIDECLKALLHPNLDPGSLDPELKVRSAQEALLFQSLVLSRLLYGAGTWSYQDETVEQRIQGVLLAMARQMLRPSYSFEDSCHLGAGQVLAVARVPSAKVLLHVERLRHLAVVTRVAPAEFWAILHHDSTWCGLALESLSWFSRGLALAGTPQDRLSEWSSAREVIIKSPALWRRWLRKAQQTALLAELWESEVHHYHGLLLRYLLSHGAQVGEEVHAPEAAGEVCAVCQQRFPNLRCWSHHAFKRHGRVREARLYAQGTQCQICLKHFASTFHLSNHLEYSQQCLAQLSSVSQVEVPMPGRGSRKFRSGKDVMLPAVTASGPVLPQVPVAFIPEVDRADDSVLSSLEDLFCCDDRGYSYDTLIQAVKAAFAGVCLQVSRLKATAREWRHRLTSELQDNEDVSINWSTWHRRIADWICDVDFVEWLVPCAIDTTKAHATFRDGTVLLPWLSFHALCVSPVGLHEGLRLRVISGTRRLLGDRLIQSVVWLCHEQCFRQPLLLNFGDWIRSRSDWVCGFCLAGLLSTTALPSPVRHFKSLERSLHRLRLFADLVRGVLHLWLNEVPAFLVAAPSDCPGLAAVKRVAPYCVQSGDCEVLSNFADPGAFAARFTF